MHIFFSHYYVMWQLLARRQIDILTAQAWLSESKELEDKVCYLGFTT